MAQKKITDQSAVDTYEVDIILGKPAGAKTWLAYTDAYRPGVAANLIVFLHGHHPPSNLPAYFKSFKLREDLNKSPKRNVALAAPALSSKSDGGLLETDPDIYIDTVLNELAGVEDMDRGPGYGLLL